MPELLIGMLGFVLVAVIFCAGCLAGWKLHAFKMRAPTPEELGEQERKRLIEEQNAFRELMGYSAEVAYGLTSDTSGGEE